MVSMLGSLASQTQATSRLVLPFRNDSSHPATAHLVVFYLQAYPPTAEKMQLINVAYDTCIESRIHADLRGGFTQRYGWLLCLLHSNFSF